MSIAAWWKAPRSAKLFRGQVSEILLAFRAKRFQQLGVGNQGQVESDAHRFSEGLRIVEPHLHLHVAEVASMKAFGDAQRVAVNMADRAQPGLIVESGALHYQPVALPFANRITEPGRLWIVRKFPFVGEYMTVGSVGFARR